VPGIGVQRSRKLLTEFGSVDGIRAASRAALESAVGKRAAGDLWRALHEASVSG